MAPVNAVACVTSYILAISVQKVDPSRIVGWLYTDQAIYVLYLGIVPGILGHTTFNYLMKTISPLLISAFVNFEPLIGSMIGWFAGYQNIPGILTWVGGGITIIGNTMITIAERRVEKIDEEGNSTKYLLDSALLSVTH